MQQVPQQQFNQVLDDRVRVQGIENAKLYPIAPNTTTILWDVDDKTFYKITAGSPIKVYEYYDKDSNIDIEESDEEIQSDFDFSEYVRLDDLQNIVSKMIDEKLNNKVIEPQSVVKEVQQKPSRTMTRKKGDK